MTLEEFLNSLSEEDLAYAQEVLQENPQITVIALSMAIRRNEKKIVL